MLRGIYIATLAILGLLLVFAVMRPLTGEESFSEVTQESIIQKQGEWIIQFDIINMEGKDTNYIINWSTGEEIYNSKVVLIRDGRTFTNIHHVYPETVENGKIRLNIQKVGDTFSFEEATYFLK